MRHIAAAFCVMLVACSSQQSTNSDSPASPATSVLATTTTVDEAAILRAKQESFLFELFLDRTSGTEISDPYNSTEDHPYFASIEDVSQQLREGELFGALRYAPALENAYKTSRAFPRRELCKDWLVDEVIVQGEPKLSVTRNYEIDIDALVKTEDWEEAIWFLGSFALFMMSDLQYLNNLEAQISDQYAARGGNCEFTGKYYDVWDNESVSNDELASKPHEWWSGEDFFLPHTGLDDSLTLEVRSTFQGPTDSEFGGLTISQFSKDPTDPQLRAYPYDRMLRIFSFLPIKDLGLLALVELGFYANWPEERNMGEFVSQTAPVAGSIRALMLSKFISNLP